MVENIKVAVRVRPFSRRECELNAQCVVSMHGPTTTVLTSPPKPFTFDYSYWSVEPPDDPNYASQDMVMADMGNPILDHTLKGYNSCVFAYGQTGTGKSFSIMGFPQTPGIVPMVIEALFAQKEKPNPRNEELRIWVSFVELYNERLRDLLQPSLDVQDLRVQESPDMGVYIPSLTEAPCKELADVHKLMDFGTKKRVTASTNMNATSSRSHAIFSIRVQRLSGPRPAEGKRDDRKVLTARLSLVDLAGSERVGRTGTTDVIMRREGCAINQSLTALGVVVKEILKYQERNAKRGAKALKLKDVIPFRASKLTFLLRESLMGNSKTFMLATISPASTDLQETLSTLRFAASVKKIRTMAKQNSLRKEDQLSSLQAGIKRIRQEMEAFPEESVTGTVAPSRRAMALEEIAERERLAGELRKPHQQQLEEARHLEASRDALFRDKGLTEEGITEAVGIDKNVPYLLNMNEDPALAGCIMYFLPNRMVVTVGADPDNKIVIKGLGIPPKLCSIENMSEEITVSMYVGSESNQNARVCINGSTLRSDERRVLKHNDKLFLGRSAALRLIIPEAARMLGKMESMALPEDVHETDLIRSLMVEDSRAWGELQLYLEDLWQRLGEDRGRELFDYLGEASHLVDEANEITAELRSDDRLKFEVELVWDIHRDAQDIIVIRLLEYTPRRRDENLGEGQADDAEFTTRVVTYWTLPKFKVRLDHMRDCYDQHLHHGGWANRGDSLEDPWMEPAILELRQRMQANVDVENQRRQGRSLSPRQQLASGRLGTELENAIEAEASVPSKETTSRAGKAGGKSSNASRRSRSPSAPPASGGRGKRPAQKASPGTTSRATPAVASNGPSPQPTPATRVGSSSVTPATPVVISPPSPQTVALSSTPSYPELQSSFIVGGNDPVGEAGEGSSGATMQKMPSGAVSKDELIATLQQQLKDKADKEELYKLRIVSLQQQIDLYDQHVLCRTSSHVSPALSPIIAPTPLHATGTVYASPQEVTPSLALRDASMLIPVVRGDRDASVRSDSTGPVAIRDTSLIRDVSSFREASSAAVRETSREPSWQRRSLLPHCRQVSPPSRVASPMRQLSPAPRSISATRSVSASMRIPASQQAKVTSRVIRTASPVRAGRTAMPKVGGSTILPIANAGGSGCYQMVTAGSGSGRSQSVLVSSPNIVNCPNIVNSNLVWGGDASRTAEERDRSLDRSISKVAEAPSSVQSVPPLPLPACDSLCLAAKNAAMEQAKKQSLETGLPVAAAGIDTNNDGRANYYYVGLDQNRDGIPDALQPGLCAKDGSTAPQATASGSRMMPVIATRTVPVLKRLSELSPEGPRSGLSHVTPAAPPQVLSPISAGTRMLYPTSSPPPQAIAVGGQVAR